MTENVDGSRCSRGRPPAAHGRLDEGTGDRASKGVSGNGFHTLDDFDVKGRRVLLRIDMNSPVDEKTLRLVDGSKIRGSIPTVRELIDRGARVAIVAHQGRPGDYDFIPLNEHAAFLSQYLGRKVRYVDDLLGPYAAKAVENLGDGECILLKNVRFLEEEQLMLTPAEHAKSRLVKTLAPQFDLFVNDAFGSSHRSHASLVGFTEVLPSAAGRLMEREVKTLTRVFQNPERPSTFILGGAKFADALPVVEKLVERPSVDNVILAGLAGYAFIWVGGKRVGSKTEELIKKDLPEEAISKAKEILKKGASKIHLPVDAAIDVDGKRREHPITQLPPGAAIMDIGTDTISRFNDIITKSRTVFLSGPPGVFEKEEFSKGTREMLTAITSSEAFTVIGGGHSCAAANKFGVLAKYSYVSTGGGALERLMMGKEMPVVEALKASAKRY
ncbi:MAG TPA: phosphoglycerate kinase [Thermoplasmata archaeon]|nr:phosphoglycerate kinase [Thermoplasmata archaeon]